MKKTYLLLVIALFVAFSGCGLKKMVKNSPMVQYTVSPNPLEYKGGQVPVKVDVTFPAKYFNKKAYLVATPVLVTKDGANEKEFRSQTIQGEKVQDNNPVIPYKSGGSYSYVDSFPYDATYRNSDLVMKVKVYKNGKGKTYTFGTVNIGKGIITTPLLVDEGLKIDNGTMGNTGKGLMNFITPTIGLPQTKAETQQLVLYYPKQRDVMDSKEQKKQAITDFMDNVASAKNNPDMQFQGITVASYASPEGPQQLNHSLVVGRGDNSSKFLNDKFKKAKIDNSNDFLKRNTTPDEDWEGFQKAVQASNLQDKELILRVLSMYSDPEVREREIKKMAAVYDQLRTDILPQLRRSEIIATYQTRQKTAAELISLGKTNPDKLSQEELFYAGQEAQGTDKEMIYKSYVAKYTTDWKGFNNLGVYYIQNNQLDQAELQLQKAENIDKNNASIMNNMGVLYYAKGDFTKAEEYFNKAAKIDPNDEINYNLGVLYIKKGFYSQAVQKFGATPSYNKSLAQVLNGGTKDAITTLDKVKSDAAFYFYLKAVESARNSDLNGVLTNLKSAIQKDANIKAYAKDDLEFRAYFEDENFKSIVQ